MPANTTQFNFRLLDPALDLAVDHFVINDPGFSADYAIDLQVRSPSSLALAALIGKKACLTLYGEHGKNFFHGIISKCSSVGVTPDGKEYVYALALRSPLHFLQLKTSHRIFVQSTIVDVAYALLKPIGFDDSQIVLELQTIYAPLEFMTQIDETDYDFLYRTLAHWGVFYFLWQDANQFKFVLADDSCVLNDISSVLSYKPLTGTMRAKESVFQMRKVAKASASKTIVRDYNPDTLDVPLEAEFARAGVGTQYLYAEYATSLNETALLARVRQELLDWQRNVVWIETDCPTLQIGQRLSVTDCPIAEYNDNYRIVALEHIGNQEAGKIYAAENAAPTYLNKALCIPADVPYRPLVAKKKILGFFSAHIESQSDNAYLNENGAYRIRFPFDSSNPKTQASAPVRLLQPYSGKDFGFHFPLRNGTEVLCAFENGDPHRPIVLGALPNPNAPSPVTAENFTQHRLRTLSGNELCMDDCAGNSNTQLFTQDKQHLLHLDATDGQHQIRLTTQQGKMQINAQQNFTTETGTDWTQTIGKDHHVAVGNQYQVATQQGNIEWNAMRDLKLTAKQNLSVIAKKNLAISSGQDMRLEVAQGAAINAENSMVITANNFYLQSGQGMLVEATGQGDIVLAQSGAMVRIAKDGSISLKAKQINVYSQQNNLVGTQGHLGGEGQAAQVPQIKMPLSIKVIWRANDSTNNGFANPVIKKDIAIKPDDEFGLEGIGKLDDDGSRILHGVQSGYPTIQSNELEIICINDKQQSPWQKAQINIPDGNNEQEPDAAHTYYVKTLWPPIIKDYYAYVATKNNPPQLSADELHYFKTNGNNAVIFIHGFNIGKGEFGQYVQDVTVDTTDEVTSDDPDKIQSGNALFATCSGYSCTIYRNLDDLRTLFPQIPENITYINNEDSDVFINGLGAHNWLLHMENNLNCAAANMRPFNWQQDALKYTRIIGINWPGDTGITEYLNAEEPAHVTGTGLVDLIKQLHAEGIAINIIAHSLGSRVLLTAMEKLAQEGITDILENAFLWEAAVPNNALSPVARPDLSGYNNVFPNAYKAAKQTTVLYSKRDWILWLAYHAAIGHAVKTQDSEFLQRYLGTISALGYAGPDADTLGLGKKIIPFDQEDWLSGHSYMKDPSPNLFKHVYQEKILASPRFKLGKYPHEK